MDPSLLLKLILQLDINHLMPTSRLYWMLRQRSAKLLFKKPFPDSVLQHWLVLYFVELNCINIYAQEPWNQEKFEQLLVKWLVACDQPFTEVEQEEFIELLQYVHHSGGQLHIPKSDAIRQKVIKLGDQTIGEIHDMFTVSKIFLMFF